MARQMTLRDLNARMRGFEEADDVRVPPGVFMVARLDGRGFSRLVREVLGFDDPYPEAYRDAMVEAAGAIMRGGFHVIYGHTQSDEFSLLFHPDTPDFGRRVRKYYSVLAGLASASFSLHVGTLATFDCRISRLPDLAAVTDYFHWRAQDAERNALNTRCQWALRTTGASPRQISDALHGASTRDKKARLADEYGIAFNELPGWCRRGVALYWERRPDEVLDHETGAPRTVIRQHLVTDLELPSRRKYASLLRERLGQILGQREDPPPGPSAAALQAPSP